MTTRNRAGQAGLREWLGLAVIALPCAVYAMDLTVLNLAVPALSADLDPSATQLRPPPKSSSPRGHCSEWRARPWDPPPSR